VFLGAARLSEVEEEIEEASGILEQYRELVEEDIQKRDAIISLLTEALEKQEKLLNASLANKQSCADKLEQIDKTKESLKVCMIVSGVIILNAH
jgi:hypothetical protein